MERVRRKFTTQWDKFVAKMQRNPYSAEMYLLTVAAVAITTVAITQFAIM